MNFYQLSFNLASGEEGPNFRYKTSILCKHCGIYYLPFDSEYLVPEETVDYFDAYLWDPLEHPLFLAAGLLVVEQKLSQQMMEVGLTGFRLTEAPVYYLNDEDTKPPLYKWVQVTGRCRTNDVWERVVSICPICQSPKTERVTSPIRRVVLLNEPQFDLSRSREPQVKIVVSERFVEVVRQADPAIDEYMELKPLPLMAELT